jgi:hypothetical protein
METARYCNKASIAYVPSHRDCQKIASITLIVTGIIALIIGSLALYNQFFTSLSGFYKIPSLAVLNRTYSIMLVVGGALSSLLGLGGIITAVWTERTEQRIKRPINNDVILS